MYQASVSQREFTAAVNYVCHAMAKNDCRYYLNGLNIRVLKDQLRIEATDGHRLACVTILATGHTLPTGFDLILKNTDVKIIAKQFKTPARGADPTLMLSIKGDGSNTLTLNNGTSFCTYKLIDAKYPDCGKVIPSKDDAAKVVEYGFNANYLAELGKAAKFLASKKHNGIRMFPKGPKESCLFEVPLDPSYATLRDAKAVLMPMMF